MYRTLLLTSAAALAFAYGPAPTAALAEQDEAQQQEMQQEAEELEAAEEEAAEEEELAEQPDDEAVAHECLDELQTTARTLAAEGYWITGWGQRWGWGGGQTGMTAHPDDVPPATGAVPEDDAAAPDAPAAETPAAGDPWGLGPMHGMASPRHQLRSLFSAAHVLAYQGDQEGCEYVLARLQMTAEDHLEQLREAGVDPQEVVDWRREAMAAAVPLTQLEPAGIQLENLTGADVRNLEDEYLGSVSDIILDAEEGDPEYVIVARGGFLGIGEDHIMVPWEDLAAAPQLNTLILDVSEAEMEQAPAVDPDVAMDAEWMDEYREQTDAYWQDRREG